MFASLISGAFALALAAVILAFAGAGPVLPFVIAFAVLVYCIFKLRALRFGGPALVVLVVQAPGLALAATVDIGQAVNGSLQEIINAAVAAAIAALIGWVAMVVKKKFNVDIEAQYRDALTAFLQRQASSLVADGMVKVSGIKVEVQSAALAAAADAALAAIPQALKFFNLTPDRVQAMIFDMLPKQPAVAAAQAVALDVGNPATPSKAA